LTRKFNKFLKKNNNKNQSFNRYNSKKLNDFNSNKYTCFGCGEQGHIKVDCPNNENKERGASKKGEKKGKAKKAYIAWQDNEVSSSSSSSGDEEANLCLMAKEETDVSSVSFNSSINFENYNQLFDAFKETHEEANRLALSNNRLKGLNNWLENRVKVLEEELDNLKSDFENLELIYKNSSYKCDSNVCENCESFEKKVHCLVKTVDKLSKGKSNFEVILYSKKCVFGKAGLDFNPQSKKSGVSKPFSTFF